MYRHELPGRCSLEQTAAYFGVTSQTIRNWLAAKKFPKPKRIGRENLWTEDDLLVFKLFGKADRAKLTAAERQQLGVAASAETGDGTVTSAAIAAELVRLADRLRTTAHRGSAVRHAGGFPIVGHTV